MLVRPSGLPNSFGYETIEIHAARHFNDASQHVGRHTVLPCCPRLIGEGHSAEIFRHRGIVLPLVDNIRGFVGLLDMWAGEMRVSQAGGVPQQILHGHLASRRLDRQRFRGRIVRIGGDLEIGEGWDIPRNRIRNQQLALLGQHHRRNRGDWLCH